MAESIKCACSHCGAKYRLPVEAQGRTARCKRCGNRFEIPREQSLEDSIMSWLMTPEEDEDEVAPAKPRVITMPNEPDNDGSEPAKRIRGTIRMKTPTPEKQT